MSDPVADPRLAAATLIADLVETADLHRDTGVCFAIAVVVKPRVGTLPLTLLTNDDHAAAQRVLLNALLRPTEQIGNGDLPP